jgi:uncharacterized protein
MFTVRTSIRPSTIHGIGCFAEEKINKGQVVWEFDPRFDMQFPENDIASLPEIMQDFLHQYSDVKNFDGRAVFVLSADHSRYMNHADAPNLEDSPNGLQQIALRDIQPNEELTCNYYTGDLHADKKMNEDEHQRATGISLAGFAYLSPKAQAQIHPQKGGYGVYARETIHKDEIIATWGGKIVNLDDIRNAPPKDNRQLIQIEENLLMLSPVDDEPSDYFNHSCAPNAGIRGQITLVAMREIQPGEELCFDYAMCDSAPYDEFPCACGVPECRGYISAEDWRIPELQERYEGYFATYLKRRIEKMQEEQ